MIDKIAIFVGFASAFLIGLNICIMINKLRFIKEPWFPYLEGPHPISKGMRP